MAPPSSNCCTTYGVLRDETTAQAWLISDDPYIYTPQLPLPAPAPTTPPTTHQPTPHTLSHGPYGRRASPSPRPPDPLGLSGTASCFRLFVVSCVLCGLHVEWRFWTSHFCSSLVGRSCWSVRVVPQIPGHFCVWVPPSAGLRFGRRKITNYKLQITL